jgi:serine/threonine protein kinase
MRMYWPPVACCLTTNNRCSPTCIRRLLICPCLIGCNAQHLYYLDRDLKLDNTLLDGSRPPRVKLCDFGFAKDFEPGQNLMTNIG